MRSSFILALLLAGPVAADEPGPTRDAFVALTDPLGEPVDKVVYLDQGWSPAVSLKFYVNKESQTRLCKDLVNVGCMNPEARSA